MNAHQRTSLHNFIIDYTNKQLNRKRPSSEPSAENPRRPRKQMKVSSSASTSSVNSTSNVSSMISSLSSESLASSSLSSSGFKNMWPYTKTVKKKNCKKNSQKRSNYWNIKFRTIINVTIWYLKKNIKNHTKIHERKWTFKLNKKIIIIFV